MAAVGDLHVRLDDRPGRLRQLFQNVSEEADLLLLAGDLTDHGAPEEAALLVEGLSGVRIPIVAVLGNHDHESGKAPEVSRMLSRGGIHLLDGDVFVFEKRVGIAGVKGFGGGFGRATLEPWGEEVVKQFVLEGVHESLKLETAMSRIRDVEKRIALLHYSPIRTTIEDENPEIIAFLGCSRLADSIDKFSATLALHGHAHHGRLEGYTARGTRVCNVALELLRACTGSSYRVIELA